MRETVAVSGWTVGVNEPTSAEGLQGNEDPWSADDVGLLRVGRGKRCAAETAGWTETFSGLC